MSEDNWNKQAKNILKASLKRKNLTYQNLAKELDSIGIEENQNSIATKLSRGSFSFSFFLQCMCVLKINKIELDLQGC